MQTAAVAKSQNALVNQSGVKRSSSDVGGGAAAEKARGQSFPINPAADSALSETTSPISQCQDVANLSDALDTAGGKSLCKIKDGKRKRAGEDEAYWEHAPESGLSQG